MKITNKSLVLTFLLAFPALSFADIAVVTRLDSPLKSLDKETVIGIFMKKKKEVEGISFAPLDLPKGDVRNRFYELVADRTADNMLAYWYRLMFTGKGMPPPEVTSPEEMLQRISNEPDAIGYVEADIVNEKANEKVKILLLLKE